MRRKLLEKMKLWKDNPQRKPLVLLGARQVGKTWAMKCFGELEYESVAYINCDEEPLAKSLFAADYNITRILLTLQAITGTIIKAEKTLIIFDELQKVERGLHSLKYFHENAPQYHVMAAVSLLGITIGRDKVFPVGKVDILHIHPLDFEEFQMAAGEEQPADFFHQPDCELLNVLGAKHTNLLRLNHLDTGYGHIIVGHDLCATLRPATLTALLGPNGSGKSTLLRTIAGLQKPVITPHNGENDTITLNGQRLTMLPPNELAKKLSIVLTYRPEADMLTAGEVVEMGRIPYVRNFTKESEKDGQMVEKALKLTGTEALRLRPVSQLSDGERQRVFIAKALAQDTPVILLDEPTAFLDFPSKVATLRLLARLAHEEGKTVLVSTHDVEHALAFSDELWLLSGNGIESGTPHGLAKDGTLAAFFNKGGTTFDPLTMRFDFQR